MQNLSGNVEASAALASAVVAALRPEDGSDANEVQKFLFPSAPPPASVDLFRRSLSCEFARRLMTMQRSSELCHVSFIR